MERYTGFPQEFSGYLPAQNSPTESLFDHLEPQYASVTEHDLFEYDYPTYEHSFGTLGQHAVEYPDAFVQRQDAQPATPISQTRQAPRPPRLKISPLELSPEWQRPSIFVPGSSVESLSSDTSDGSAELSPLNTQFGIFPSEEHRIDVPSTDGPQNTMAPPSSPFPDVDLSLGRGRHYSQAVSYKRERPSGTTSLRPGMCMPTSDPKPYGSLDLPTSVLMATTHSTRPTVRAPTAQQCPNESQQIMPVSMPMPLRLYSHPMMHFNGATFSSDGSISSGPELSPLIGFRQLKVEDSQGACNPQFVNGNLSGDGDGDEHGYETSGSEGSTKREAAQSTGKQRTSTDGWGHEYDLWEDDYADGDDEDDGDYEENDEDDDGEYVISNRRSFTSRNTHSLRQRQRASMSPTSSRYHPYPDSNDTSNPIPSSPYMMSLPKTRTVRQVNSHPIPVPNLTKKSRGRRVPTLDSLRSGDGHRKGGSRRDENEGEYKNPRTFVCDTVGCGKCFARGEHLKRHVRSIHTHEKRGSSRSCPLLRNLLIWNADVAHTCPHPDCRKGFSRYDNLRQHLRVHKDYVKSADICT